MDNIFLEDIRHACKNSIVRLAAGSEVTEGKGPRDVSRADFDGSKISPSISFFSSRITDSVFVFCFSADKTPRRTGYSLTVDDIAHARDTLGCEIAARSSGRFAAAVVPE